MNGGNGSPLGQVQANKGCAGLRSVASLPVYRKSTDRWESRRKERAS